MINEEWLKIEDDKLIAIDEANGEDCSCRVTGFVKDGKIKIINMEYGDRVI